MKKFIFVLIACFALCGCSDEPDAAGSLPYIDASKYYNESSIVFPINTPSLDIYACLKQVYGEGTHSIKASYTRTESAILNGVKYTDTLTETIVQIKIYSRQNEIDTVSGFYVDFYCTSGKVLNYCYKWQYHNTHVWTNTPTDGDITITL